MLCMLLCVGLRAFSIALDLLFCFCLYVHSTLCCLDVRILLLELAEAVAVSKASAPSEDSLLPVSMAFMSSRGGKAN